MILGQSAVDRQAPLRALEHRFSEAEPGVGFSLVYVFALLAVLLGAAWLMNQWQRRRANSTSVEHMGLYLRVQKKLGFSLWDRWRLWRLAKITETEYPTVLLISEKLYDGAVRNYCTSRGWITDRAGAAPQLASIRSRLFPA